MKYYLVAGEASGDLHGSNLMKEIKAQDPTAEFRFWGGDLMAAQGGTLVSHYKERAFMGLWEVIKNIKTISNYLRKAEEDIVAYQPDALIFIDNPGFNLRLAEFGKNAGFNIHYYIAPKVWAWNEKRVNKIKKNVDYLYSILPFEPAFFSKHHVNTDYVGNPVVDAVSGFTPTEGWKEKYNIQKPVIALLPGSRKNEIERMLPLMMQLPSAFPDYSFVIAAAPNFDQNYFNQFTGIESMKICFGETYDILSHSTAAVVTSGTATLETALFKVPQVVCYKVAAITYVVGRLVVKLKWFGLVNLILNRPLLTELLQGKFKPSTVIIELGKILTNPDRQRILDGYVELQSILGGSGASEKTAALIVTRTQHAATKD